MSVQIAINEVSDAIYALLMPAGSIDSTLSANGIIGIFDFANVPQNQPFDYLTLGDCQEGPQNTLGRRGYLLNYGIHIWSRYRGVRAAANDVERLNELLDQPIVPLTLATHTHVSTMYQRTSTSPPNDGLTVHLIAKYQIYVQE